MFTCFGNKSLGQIGYVNSATDRDELDRICTIPDKPLLVFTQGDYNVFYQQLAAFQHRIVAKHILVSDGLDKLIEMDVDSLTGASSQQLSSLVPPPDSSCAAQPSSDGQRLEAGHRLTSVDPVYPEFAKQRRIQGTVRLAAKIGADGRLTSIEVLHSPDPMLTAAAEQAVRQWTYAPYLVDGRPVEVNSVIQVHYHLGR